MLSFSEISARVSPAIIAVTAMTGIIRARNNKPVILNVLFILLVPFVFFHIQGLTVFLLFIRAVPRRLS